MSRKYLFFVAFYPSVAYHLQNSSWQLSQT